MYSCNISNKSCPLMGLSNNINNSLQSVSCLFYFLVILSSNFIRKKSKHAMWHSNRQPWTERSEKGCFFSVQCAAVKKKGKKKSNVYVREKRVFFLDRTETNTFPVILQLPAEIKIGPIFLALDHDWCCLATSMLVRCSSEGYGVGLGAGWVTVAAP